MTSGKISRRRLLTATAAVTGAAVATPLLAPGGERRARSRQGQCRCSHRGEGVVQCDDVMSCPA